MDSREIKLFMVPPDKVYDTEGRDAPENVLVYLEHLHTDVALSEVEDIILGALREIEWYPYEFKSSHRKVDLGASFEVEDLVAYVAPHVNSATSTVVVTLTALIVKEVFEKIVGALSSQNAEQTLKIGLEACEEKARQHMRSKFGQEAAISLLSTTKVEGIGYAFEFECGDLSAEVTIGTNGDFIAYRRT